MNDTHQIKELIYSELLDIVNERIENSKVAILSAKESKNQETKSTAGDKYETGRAMMQFEQEKNEVQLNKSIGLKNILKQLDIQKQYSKVESGSLVFTNRGNYFVSIGIGKIHIKQQVFYCISLDSPVGMLLYGKAVGEKCVFQGNEILVKEIT